MTETMKAIALIPARYASTRFPGKPLAQLAGKPIIQHVVERTSQLVPTYVATDDKRIFDCVTGFGGNAVMTGSNHKSGTDRIHEALKKLDSVPEIVVNVQGDEPFIATEQIKMVLNLFDDPSVQIGTLVKPFESLEAIKNPNSPKVVCDAQNNALLFSRSVIPYIRSVEEKHWLSRHTFLKHIGLYAYRTHVLDEIVHLPQSPLELAESLEQLRWLQAGYKIRVAQTDIETIGIDTPEDLERAEKFLHKKN